jgi:hypothetical protein
VVQGKEMATDFSSEVFFWGPNKHMRWEDDLELYVVIVSLEIQIDGLDHARNW